MRNSHPLSFLPIIFSLSLSFVLLPFILLPRFFPTPIHPVEMNYFNELCPPFLLVLPQIAALPSLPSISIRVSSLISLLLSHLLLPPLSLFPACLWLSCELTQPSTPGCPIPKVLHPSQYHNYNLYQLSFPSLDQSELCQAILLLGIAKRRLTNLTPPVSAELCLL